MSDPYTWHAPGAAPTPPQAGSFPPPPGFPPPTGTVPPPGGSFPPPTGSVPPFGASHGWAPPPKPGLIPLRPLSFGTLLVGSFQVMRRNPRPTFGFSLLLNAAIVVLFALVLISWTAYAISRLSNAAVDDQSDIVAGSVLGGGLTLLIPTIASFAVSAILQGVISLEVARATLGEKNTTRELFRRARGRIGALIGWTFAIIGASLAVVIVATVVIGPIFAFGGEGGIVIGIILVLGAVLAMTVLYAWIGTKLSLVPSVLMLERVTLGRAIARSWSLTNRSFWKTFGILFLVQTIVSIATQVITFPVSLATSIFPAFLAPTGQVEAMIAIVVISYVVLGVLTLLITALTTVMVSATTSLIYIDLRMRKEGLDLELMRFVEARQSGDTSVADPYVVGPQPTPAPPTGWA